MAAADELVSTVILTGNHESLIKLVGKGSDSKMNKEVCIASLIDGESYLKT